MFVNEHLGDNCDLVAGKPLGASLLLKITLSEVTTMSFKDRVSQTQDLEEFALICLITVAYTPPAHSLSPCGPSKSWKEVLREHTFECTHVLQYDER
jgi:hypothetical protein